VVRLLLVGIQPKRLELPPGRGHARQARAARPISTCCSTRGCFSGAWRARARSRGSPWT
jgi:hypothetical protein